MVGQQLHHVGIDYFAEPPAAPDSGRAASTLTSGPAWCLHRGSGTALAFGGGGGGGAPRHTAIAAALMCGPAVPRPTLPPWSQISHVAAFCGPVLGRHACCHAFLRVGQHFMILQTCSHSHALRCGISCGQASHHTETELCDAHTTLPPPPHLVGQACTHDGLQTVDRQTTDKQ